MKKVTVEMFETFDGQQFRSENLAMQYLSAVYQNTLHDIAMELQASCTTKIKTWLDTNPGALENLLTIRKNINS